MEEQREALIERLKRENGYLAEQGMLLAKAEDHLYHIQNVLDRQLRRIDHLNKFALEASRSFDRKTILRLAMEMLMDTFSFEQGVALSLNTTAHLIADTVIGYDQGQEQILSAARWPMDRVRIGQLIEPSILTPSCTGDISYQWFLTHLDQPLPKSERGLFTGAVNLFLPLWRRQQQFLGLILLRVKEVAHLSYHADIPHIDDIPYFQLVARHLVTTLEEAFLYQEIKESAEKLARSNAELEQFAYIISHDLKEPLRTVASFVGLLEKKHKDQLGPDAGELIAYAVDGATRMDAMIDDLLKYSRIVRSESVFQTVNCTEVVEEALRNLKISIEESETTVSYNSLPTIFANRTQILQLFQNLIANAIKFRDQERPRVDIAAEHGINASEWVFSIQDNGIGIEPTHFDRIFRLFQRLHTRKNYPGTGIGLAICKKIVERHGGRIWVDSQSGRGSTFYFTMPA